MRTEDGSIAHIQQLKDKITKLEEDNERLRDAMRSAIGVVPEEFIPDGFYEALNEYIN